MKRTPLLVAALLVAAVATVSMPGAAVAAPPLNDSFAAASPIDTGSLPFTDTVNTTEATFEAGETGHCGISKTVWYSITPSTDVVLRIDSSGSGPLNTVLVAYRQAGSGLSGLSFVNCSTAFWNPITLSAEAGTTYYIQAGGYFGQSGSLRLNVERIPPPANDDFADAVVVDELPFIDEVRDLTAATVEAGEPPSSCVFPPMARTMWFAFTPDESMSLTASIASGSFASGIVAYTGDSLGSLTEVGCVFVAGQLVMNVDAGTTYWFQVGGRSTESGLLAFQVAETPDPVAGFGHDPADPSTLDTVQFVDFSYDPGGVGVASQSWSFGDGGTAEGCCPQHRYEAEGDYDVMLEVTTGDGRTAAITQTVHVQTHDVAIQKVTVPTTAKAGQTRSITVGLTNNRYPENVDVQLLKSVAGGGWEQVGVLTQLVPVRGNRTTNFTFNYTFSSADASLGKVTFQAIANIQSARDAIPADNTFISLPTKVNP
jgi:PKD domain